MMRLIMTMWLMLVFCIANGKEPRTPHTFVLSEGETAPIASLEDASWLIGSWRGTAFGNQFEQVWAPPSAGSMQGMFKIFDGDEVRFYEILTLTIDEGRMSLKVKHFTRDFIAWEEKSDYINFKLVEVGADALHFAGISFYRRSPDYLEAYMAMQGKEGLREEKLTYHRVKLIP